ncbi:MULTISPECIES: hypothetical protein [Streptomyces]|uniref:hypothetical protein n=1 Tax=Streptomyces TaxID=1883 RepID=UPI001F38C933|nr:hypothetical protein [Streptomyces sp. ms115]
MLVIICVLFSVIVGIFAGVLKHTPSTPKAPAVLFGGGVFGGSMTLLLLLFTALGAF